MSNEPPSKRIEHLLDGLTSGALAVEAFADQLRSILPELQSIEATVVRASGDAMRKYIEDLHRLDNAG